MDIPLWAWAATVAFVLALLALDFVVAARRPHEVGLREATFWSVFYIGIAIAFGVLLLVTAGTTAGTEYFAGWVVEKSLSVDNLFVFVIIMAQFSVPKEYQQKVLLFGIAVALAMRTVFIVVGAAAISAFSWTFVLFGVFLIYTAVQLARHRNEDPDIEDSKVLALGRRLLPLHEEYDGNKLVTRVDGRRVVTPLFLVFLAIGSTDLLFALDSIPAIFGITQDAYLVFAANAFALLGLRALYFLIQGLLAKLVYLSLGLSVILAFIGVKLILVFLHEGVSKSFPEVPTSVSLVVILSILVITTVASLLRVRAHPEEVAHAGSLRGHGTQPTQPGHDDPPVAVSSTSGPDGR